MRPSWLEITKVRMNHVVIYDYKTQPKSFYHNTQVHPALAKNNFPNHHMYLNAPYLINYGGKNQHNVYLIRLYISHAKYFLQYWNLYIKISTWLFHLCLDTSYIDGILTTFGNIPPPFFFEALPAKKIYKLNIYVLLKCFAFFSLVKPT